jgi:uncharacterized lipoprotein YddW (UPF0748 family)
MVQAVRGAGLNTILVQVRGRGEAYYRSDLEPRAADLRADDFDPLQTTLTLAHKAGIEVHAWVNVGLVSSAVTLPRSRQHVVVRHPEWLMVPKAMAGPLRGASPGSPAYVQALARWSRGNDDRVEGLFLSPIVPAAQEHSVAVTRELARRYAIDGIHFDYIRYPNDEFDHSRAAIAEFRASHAASVAPAERQRLDRASAANPTAWADAAPDAWASFRRERLTSLLARAAAAARAERPGLVVSAAVVPDPREARGDKLQDWEAWSRSGLLDAVCPMAYAPDVAGFADQLGAALPAAGDTPVWAGIGAYRIPSARSADHIRAARRSGAAGVLLFSYDSVIEQRVTPAYLTALRPVLTASR